MILIRNPRERGRFLRFAVVGLVGAIVDFGVMNILVNLFGVTFLVAGTVSFICAILSNFSWNRFWTYPDSRSKRLADQLLQFALISVIGLLIRVPLLAVMEPAMIKAMNQILGTATTLFLSPEFVAHNFTLALAVIVVMFWNFFANRYWTYGDVES